ncbi:extracellular solute-binding protein [Sulfurimonas sp.]|uniref:extracellular solute-binding protein n=1 Tax=Sulfurimonas sp. TaxID=2022749 RepID=UPI0035666D6C
MFNYFLLFRVFTLFLFVLFLSSCSSEKKDNIKTSKKYDGQSIIVIVPTLHAGLIRGPIIDEAEKFEKKTGARIRVVTPSWDETIQKTKQSLTDPNLNYDIFVVISMWTGTLLQNQNVAPVPEWVKEKIEWEDVLPIYRNSVLSYNNIAYGMPYDGDCINLYYRKDIFENPSIQQQFKSVTGKELSVPKTWSEYKQVAKFFNGWDWDNDGKIEYGNALLRKKSDIAMLQFFATSAAYAKHPQDKAYFFDPDSMKPRIDSPAFEEGLKDYIELVNYAPPGVVNYAGHDVRNSFVTGEVAMALDWADLGIYSVENDISILNDSQVGYAQIPGSEKVYNHKSKMWEDRYNQVSSISGSWSFFVNKDTKNKKLAFDFAAFMTSKKMTTKYVAISGNAVNPSRYSHFKDYDSWTKSGFSKEAAKRYLNEISKSLTNDNIVYDITLPGAGRYYQALDESVYEALKGNVTPKEALKKASKRWDEITDSIGRKAQISYYKESLNE